MRCLRPRPGSRIAVDRATSRCPAIPLSRGAQHKQPKPNVFGLAERRFFKACGNLQWNNIIYRCGSCHQHKRRRARPAGACCSTVSFPAGYSLVGCSSAEPASASPACHYNSSVRVCLSNIPISFDYELATPQDRIYQQILSTRQSKEESGVEMKKRLGERRNTPERKQGSKEESKRSSLVHFSPLDRPHTRGGSCARPACRKRRRCSLRRAAA